MTSFLISPENRSPLCPRQSGDDNRTGSANGGHFTTTDWLIDWLSGCDEANGTKEKRALFTKQNGWRLMKVSVNCRRVTDVCHITFWAPSSLRMIHSSGLPNGQEDRNMPSPWISTRTIQFGTLAHSIDNYFCVIRASTSLLSCKHTQKKKTTKKLTASETNLWLKGNTARAVLLPTKIASRSSSHPLRSIKVWVFFSPSLNNTQYVFDARMPQRCTVITSPRLSLTVPSWALVMLHRSRLACKMQMQGVDEKES